ncbi:hypothetical protein M3Y94_00160100 [Aphelenchoides besseyi]|nr:hypothetical protein M3Y94_00160100 [Aphelenchoides besseyi]KAI6237080.1 hypothetical protein M3Y95_00227300 [Aphelenchoides besseyi]
MSTIFHDYNKPHEAKFHETVFDPLSRPFSRTSDRSRQNNESRMGIFSDTKVPWNHFGKKYRLYFSKDEIDRGGDLFQLLIRKVRDQVPEFQGVIAYNDQTGRQVILYNDADVRQALHQMRGKLKFYSFVQPDKGYIAAADMVRSPRSQSVPPPHSRYSPDDRSPSSVDTNYNYRHEQAPNQNSYPTYGSRPPPRNVTPGAVSSYAGYGYNQPLLYGMPPHNLLLAHFLTAGHYPFSRFTFIGPNKGAFGAYPYKSYYNRGGFGPMW